MEHISVYIFCAISLLIILNSSFAEKDSGGDILSSQFQYDRNVTQVEENRKKPSIFRRKLLIKRPENKNVKVQKADDNDYFCKKELGLKQRDNGTKNYDCKNSDRNLENSFQEPKNSTFLNIRKKILKFSKGNLKQNKTQQKRAIRDNSSNKRRAKSKNCKPGKDKKKNISDDFGDSQDDIRDDNLSDDQDNDQDDNYGDQDDNYGDQDDSNGDQDNNYSDEEVKNSVPPVKKRNNDRSSLDEEFYNQDVEDYYDGKEDKKEKGLGTTEYEKDEENDYGGKGQDGKSDYDEYDDSGVKDGNQKEESGKDDSYDDDEKDKGDKDDDNYYDKNGRSDKQENSEEEFDDVIVGGETDTEDDDDDYDNDAGVSEEDGNDAGVTEEDDNDTEVTEEDDNDTKVTEEDDNDTEVTEEDDNDAGISEEDINEYKLAAEKQNESSVIPGGLGKYFVYVNCTTCKIKSQLVVLAKKSSTKPTRKPEQM